MLFVLRFTSNVDTVDRKLFPTIKRIEIKYIPTHTHTHTHTHRKTLKTGDQTRDRNNVTVNVSIYIYIYIYAGLAWWNDLNFTHLFVGCLQVDCCKDETFRFDDFECSNTITYRNGCLMPYTFVVTGK